MMLIQRSIFCVNLFILFELLALSDTVDPLLPPWYTSTGFQDNTFHGFFFLLSLVVSSLTPLLCLPLFHILLIWRCPNDHILVFFIYTYSLANFIYYQSLNCMLMSAKFTSPAQTSMSNSRLVYSTYISIWMPSEQLKHKMNKTKCTLSPSKTAIPIAFPLRLMTTLSFKTSSYRVGNRPWLLSSVHIWHQSIKNSYQHYTQNVCKI